MQIAAVLCVFVSVAGATFLQSTFRRSGPVSGAGGRNSRIRCAASCAREKTCAGFDVGDDGSCGFRTNDAPQVGASYYQQVVVTNVSISISA